MQKSTWSFVQSPEIRNRQSNHGTGSREKNSQRFVYAWRLILDCTQA